VDVVYHSTSSYHGHVKARSQDGKSVGVSTDLVAVSQPSDAFRAEWPNGPRDVEWRLAVLLVACFVSHLVRTKSCRTPSVKSKAAHSQSLPTIAATIATIAFIVIIAIICNNCMTLLQHNF